MNTLKTITLALLLVILLSVAVLMIVGYVSQKPLIQLNQEAEKTYYAADYPTALEKCQTGLEKARELGDKSYISQFLGSIGVVYRNIVQYEKALTYIPASLDYSPRNQG